MTSPQTETASFEEIRETLDPECSYIILERAVRSEEDRDFAAITPLLSCFEGAIFDRRLFYDRGRGCVSLVLKLDALRLDGIVEEFLSEALPRDITCYVYADRKVE